MRLELEVHPLRCLFWAERGSSCKVSLQSRQSYHLCFPRRVMTMYKGRRRNQRCEYEASLTDCRWLFTLAGFEISWIQPFVVVASFLTLRRFCQRRVLFEWSFISSCKHTDLCFNLWHQASLASQAPNLCLQLLNYFVLTYAFASAGKRSKLAADFEA